MNIFLYNLFLSKTVGPSSIDVEINPAIDNFMPSQKKIQIVSSLLESLKSSPNFVLIGFDKLPHTKFEELRRNLKESASLKVIKNSLLKVAASQIKKSDVITPEVLKGNSAVLTLSEDWNTGLSIFYKFAAVEGNLTFKLGILDNTVYDQNSLTKLAQLPSRDELIGKIIGSLRSPQSRLVYAMKFNMQKLVYILRNANKS